MDSKTQNNLVPVFYPTPFFLWRNITHPSWPTNISTESMISPSRPSYVFPPLPDKLFLLSLPAKTLIYSHFKSYFQIPLLITKSKSDPLYYFLSQNLFSFITFILHRNVFICFFKLLSSLLE